MSTVASHAFSLNSRPRVASARVGEEGEPILRIGGLMRNPMALVDHAAGEGVFAPAYGPAGGYPGVRAAAPLDYVAAVVRALDPLLCQAFGLGAARPAHAECNYSMVTLPAERLVADQRAPHVDTDTPMQLALLHYLCGPEHGGTGFFRHRATGFERVTPDRLVRYRAARAQDAPPGPGYAAGDSGAFVQTAAVPAAFDRMLVYRSHLLHSGLIAPAAPLSADPRRGRLTANIFLTYAPS
ncbi:DUF6445 family protein [Sphingomonas canadensis]|uniref:DUF6445 family protein n=1 Tax=Sphingomonas canadensis TaxID=1219257 RepID=A0ABW3H371_9SPHN|nr:DUF6445 family protein [Sphingomonas canadensis]MCW3835710.1 DUF6445 family protein [Sphingomonas canadensis]